MKVTRTNQTGFTPFTLSITVESEEEARALYAIFNHTRNVRLLSANADMRIRNAIGHEHYITCKTGDIIANGVRLGEFYK